MFGIFLSRMDSTKGEAMAGDIENRLSLVEQTLARLILNGMPEDTVTAERDQLRAELKTADAAIKHNHRIGERYRATLVKIYSHCDQCAIVDTGFIMRVIDETLHQGEGDGG